MKMNDYHREILTSALEARIKDVTEYQVNITNFSLAIERIGDDPELQDFKVNLEGLLASSILEQRKSQIMLDVIQSQLE
tara:strand:- start:622 stop:858 length:237 start_codon:yes stop_codon:yes gene_type:complete